MLVVTRISGNFQLRLVNRASGDVLSTFGHFGNYAGQFNRLHQVAFDSQGTLYTAEAAGRRVQEVGHREWSASLS